MKLRIFNTLRRWLHTWRSIHLADRFLLGLLLILLLHSVSNLFVNIPTTGSDPIDIVARTSAAGIFGYFISANFSPSRGKEDSQLPSRQDGRADSCNKVQVAVIAGVGIVSLCALLIFRSVGTYTPHITATLGQFRDFISGSVGFLVSCSTANHSDGTKEAAPALEAKPTPTPEPTPMDG